LIDKTLRPKSYIYDINASLYYVTFFALLYKSITDRKAGNATIKKETGEGGV